MVGLSRLLLFVLQHTYNTYMRTHYVCCLGSSRIKMGLTWENCHRFCFTKGKLPQMEITKKSCLEISTSIPTRRILDEALHQCLPQTCWRGLRWEQCLCSAHRGWCSRGTRPSSSARRARPPLYPRTGSSRLVYLKKSYSFINKYINKRTRNHKIVSQIISLHISKSVGAASQWASYERMMVYFKLMKRGTETLLLMIV